MMIISIRKRTILYLSSFMMITLISSSTMMCQSALNDQASILIDPFAERCYEKAKENRPKVIT